MESARKETIKPLVRGKLSYAIYFLASIYALQNFFFCSNWWSFGLENHTAFLSILGIVLSPLIGTFWLYYMGMTYYFTGRLLKGKASFSQIQACWAFSKTPCLISLFLWFVLIYISPQNAFIQDSRGAPSILVNLSALSIGIFSAIKLVLSIRQVQGFTVMKTLLNLFLSWILSSFFAFLIFCFLRFVLIRN